MATNYNPRIVIDGLVSALDAGNTKSFSPNVFPRGTDIYGWYVDTKGDANANACTLSRDTISSPVGNTPLKMQVTGNDPYLRSYAAAEWNLAAASSGDTWTISFYVKASQNTTGEVLLFESNGTTYYNIPNTTYNITTSWQRISFTGTFSNANTTVIQIRLDGPNSGGSGTTIWWDGLQLERGSTASDFTKNYTLDSSLNYRTLDLTRNGNNGTLTNMDGGNLNTDDGGSLTFDGTNDYVNLGSFFNYQTFTIELWVKPGTTQTNYADIFDNNHTGTQNFVLQQSASNLNQYTFGVIDASGGISVTGTIVLTASTWTHLAFTFSPSTRVIAYVNGDFHSQGNLANGRTINYVSPNLSLGRWSYGNSRFWKGNISNFKTYNRILTASEIQQNFNALRGRYGI